MLKAFRMTLAQNRRRARIEALEKRIQRLRVARGAIKEQMIAAQAERQRLADEEARERRV